MNLVTRALWQIEHDPLQNRDLATIAERCGVSTFHLSHAFLQATARSVIRYRRSRVLTEAARRLAHSDAKVLSIAIDAGYGSGEAFSRAFRKEFGVSPGAVMSSGSCETLSLTEPILMEPATTPPLAPPRFETLPETKLLGLSDMFDMQTRAEIPMLWQRFNAWDGPFPQEVGRAAYGVMSEFGEDGSFRYMAAAQVVDFDDAHESLTRLVLSKRDYAVFTHTGHISTIGRTISAVWTEELAKHHLRLAPRAVHINFERYGAEFDVTTGMGSVDYVLPLADAAD